MHDYSTPTLHLVSSQQNVAGQTTYLGTWLGMHHLRAYLQDLQDIGINHRALNLRFNRADVAISMTRLANERRPDFAP